MRKGKRFKSEDVQEMPVLDLFTVRSLSLKVHQVDYGLSTGKPSCTYKNWIWFNIPCEHFFAIFEHLDTWSWKSLPDEYLKSPHLCCDKQALNSFHAKDIINPESEIDNSLSNCYTDFIVSSPPRKVSVLYD